MSAGAQDSLDGAADEASGLDDLVLLSRAPGLHLYHLHSVLCLVFPLYVGRKAFNIQSLRMRVYKRLSGALNFDSDVKFVGDRGIS